MLCSFVSSCGIGAVRAKSIDLEDFVTGEETSKQATEFTIWADCFGDETIVAINDLTNDLVHRECVLVSLFVPPVRRANFSVSPSRKLKSD